MKIFHNIKAKMFLISAIFLITFTAIIPYVNALTWSAETQLTSNTTSDYSPAITQTADERIWVLWHTYRTGKAQIFYRVYDGTWSGDTQLTTDLSNNVNPAIVQSEDGKIWVFWSSDRMGPSGNWEIYYRTSSNNGASWSGDNRLTLDAHPDRRPSAMQAQDGKIWLVWFSNRLGNDDLFFSYYDGTWSSFGTQLTDDTSRDIDPAIIQAQDGKFWVFWSSNRTVDFELWYKTSVNNGASWSTEEQLTFYSGSWDELPSAMQAQDGKIWVTWQADRSGQDYDIYYKTFDGFTWAGDVSLVSHNDEDILPSICQSANTTIWVAWSTSRNGDFDIYYISTLADYDVAVKNVTSSSTLTYQGYDRQVQVKVRNEGLQSATFTVTAYYDSTPIGTQTVTSLAPNTDEILDFPWDTTGVPYGYYILSATASAVPGEEDLTDNFLTGDAVMMTIPGDVNGDHVVDLFDAASISAHWYPGPPIGPLGYDITPDINNDGAVNILDAAIVSSRWGQSW